MNIQDCYAEVKGDYEEVIGRLRTDERVKKFLFMFLRDETYVRLCHAMEAQNYKDAFREAHTLKGMCQNMAFSDLFLYASDLTEELRDGECSEEALTHFEEVKKRYAHTKKVIEEFQKEEE